MKFIVTTGKIYIGYMTGVWSYYFLYHNREELANKTIKYWKNNVLGG